MPCPCLNCSLISPFRPAVQGVSAVRKFLSFLLLAFAVFPLAPAGAQARPAASLQGQSVQVVQGGIADPSLGPKVEALLRQMTLEEKVGQLVQYSAGQATGPGTGRTDYKDMIGRGQIGALFNITKARDSNAFQR